MTFKPEQVAQLRKEILAGQSGIRNVVNLLMDVLHAAQNQSDDIFMNHMLILEHILQGKDPSTIPLRTLRMMKAGSIVPHTDMPPPNPAFLAPSSSPHSEKGKPGGVRCDTKPKFKRTLGQPGVVPTGPENVTSQSPEDRVHDWWLKHHKICEALETPPMPGDPDYLAFGDDDIPF